MRTITKLVALVLLLCFVSASSITLKNKHIFPGESFDVQFKASGPVDAHDVKFEFVGTTTVISVPRKAYGMHSVDIQFKAPSQPGEYEIKSSEAVLTVIVEEAIIRISGLKVEPEAISPRKIAKVTYTIENVGDVEAYNVKAKLGMVSSQAWFDFDFGEEKLFDLMEPGARVTRVKEVLAREKASGVAQLSVAVEYEFDQEKHEIVRYASLKVKTFPVIEVAAILIAVLVIGKFLIPRKVKWATS